MEQPGVAPPPTKQVTTVRHCDVHVLNQRIDEHLAAGWELRGQLFVVHGSHNHVMSPCDLYVQQMVRVLKK